MNSLVGCALMPHPPIMIPEIGKQESNHVHETVAAVRKAADFLQSANPQTVIVISPHGASFPDAAGVNMHPRPRGSFAGFGVPDISMGFETDVFLVQKIQRETDRLGVNLLELDDELAKKYRFSLQLDHGVLVPLYYLHKAGFRGQLVHLTVGLLSYEEMYTFGKAVQIAIQAGGRKTAVIASGDLSHRLTQNAPAGYHPLGAEFDKQVVDALIKMDVKALFKLDRNLVENAGECGLRPIFFLMGVLGGLHAQSEMLSYEGPFGVGYAVFLFRVPQ
ncbi:MAG: AmmeMemoRadiSam system protein B [Negativicutes bacterium]